MLEIDRIECGDQAAEHFAFAPGYRNLNHGSFGTFPTEVKSVLRHFQDECESKPDYCIRYEYPRRLDAAREAIARLIKAPVGACVFVPNATTGVNTILRNIVYEPGDVIIYFSTIYGSCQKTIEYLIETTPVKAKAVEFTYPVQDEFLCSEFEKLIVSIKTEGLNPKLAIFETISSLPGIRIPFERLTDICRTHGVLSCIDGAHSVGQIPLDMSTLDPDFYVSNCHKWLHVPRGCAVLYVPMRHHPSMRSTLPTSHGFVPRKTKGINNPLPPSVNSEFVNAFEFVGTIDNAPYLCVPAALAWRKKIVYADLHGEEAIMKYCVDIARQGGKAVAETLKTVVMDNDEKTLTKCAFANVELPLSMQEDASGESATGMKIAQWMSKVILDEYNTFLAILIHGDKFWVRLSGQIYLTKTDYEWSGQVLAEVCARVKKGEWK